MEHQFDFNTDVINAMSDALFPNPVPVLRDPSSDDANVSNQLPLSETKSNPSS